MTILIALIGLSILIFLHELGHFLAAKLFNIKVTEFMIGLPGPKLFSFRRGETTYGATIVLLGGYVKPVGLDPFEKISPEDLPRSLNKASFWKRLVFVSAGPLVNLVFALLVMIAIFSIAGVPTITTEIGKVDPRYPAAKAGFKKGDRIVSFNNQKITKWEEIFEAIRKNPNKKVKIVVKRGSEFVILGPTLTKRERVGFLGVGPRVKLKKLGLLTSFVESLETSGRIVAEIGRLLYMAFTGKGKVLLEQTRGPVGIVYETSRLIKDLTTFAWILAIISIGLAIANLLPIPPLDGGRVAIFLIEKLVGGSLDERKVVIINTIGMIFLLSLMIYFTVTDIHRIILNISRPT